MVLTSNKTDAARLVLAETTWEAIRDQIKAATPDGCSDSHARRVINELRIALAFLLW